MITKKIFNEIKTENLGEKAYNKIVLNTELFDSPSNPQITCATFKTKIRKLFYRIICDTVINIIKDDRYDKKDINQFIIDLACADELLFEDVFNFGHFECIAINNQLSYSIRNSIYE